MGRSRRYDRFVGLALGSVIAFAACGAGEVADRTGGSAAAAAPQREGGGLVAGQPPGGLRVWVADIRAGLEEVVAQAEAADFGSARDRALQLYIGRQEYIEIFYGAGGQLVSDEDRALAAAVKDSEARFHALLQLLNERPEPSPDRVTAAVTAVRAEHERVLREAEAAGVPPAPPEQATGESVPEGPALPVARGEARTPEVRAILEKLAAAERAYRAGDVPSALAWVEEAYLEQFESVEARLPAASVRRVERLIHLELRPRISRGAPTRDVERTLGAIRGELSAVDARLAGGMSFFFGAVNGFVIIVREGLEAVLLIAAVLAYLARIDSEKRHRRRIYAGVAAGVAASAATWVIARTLVPIGGAHRELLEGITALLAVGVLIYVSNWLFQRTYIHDWKEYLKGKVGEAVTTGSALAMAALAFAAVYREGFETVLFYQALLFQAGAGAVLSGFLPGLLLIVVLAVAIIRLGVRLPLRRLFGATNAVLVYLAFVFLGKGLYNLQEAGLFAPRPLPWMPDHEALRQLLGLYPVAETWLAQAAFLVLLAATYLYYRRRQAELARLWGRVHAVPEDGSGGASHPAVIADAPGRLGGRRFLRGFGNEDLVQGQPDAVEGAERQVEVRQDGQPSLVRHHLDKVAAHDHGNHDCRRRDS